MMNMKRTIQVASLLVMSITCAAFGYVETWDDTEAANHNWVTDYDQQGVWHPMFHETTGSVPGGHVWSDLSDLLVDVFPGGGVESSPAWLQNPDTEQDVDFTDKTIRISTKLDAGSDLGGSLYFYIGTWSNGGHFFYNSQPIIPGDDDWLETVMYAGGTGDDSAWSDLYVVNEELQACDIFDQPEEYGFMILLDTGAASGTLRFDNFQVVPEPLGILLLAAAAPLIHRRRRAS